MCVQYELTTESKGVQYLKLERSDVYIVKRVRIAIKRLHVHDSYLLENNASERCIAHKLAEHLQRLFPLWNVDCEYNLNMNEIKVLEGLRECDERRATDRVFPDIIIHKRGLKKNLLVIEIKKNHLDPKCDEKKLELFTAPEGEYNYVLGLFLKFTGTKTTEQWYKNGKNDPMMSKVNDFGV